MIETEFNPKECYKAKMFATKNKLILYSGFASRLDELKKKHQLDLWIFDLNKRHWNLLEEH